MFSPDPTQACLYPNRTQYDRTVLGFSSYNLGIRICDNGSPPLCLTNALTLIIEPRNNVPPKPGHKTVTVYYFNTAGNDVPIGNVFIDGSDDWNLNERTFKFDDSSSNEFFQYVIQK